MAGAPGGSDRACGTIHRVDADRRHLQSLAVLRLLACYAVFMISAAVPARPQQHATTWHSESTGGLTIHWQGEQPLGAIARAAWAEARQRFPPHGAVAADLTVAPDTAAFRQLARQPGWMLASTQGARVVTQPATILQTHGGAHSVFLHELLHVLVEAECTRTTPLWLREGLAEALAGEAGDQQRHVPLAALEHALQHPASWRESQAGHQAAAALVTRLIGRYGVGAVRGWLAHGVPAGVVAVEAG